MPVQHSPGSTVSRKSDNGVLPLGVLSVRKVECKAKLQTRHGRRKVDAKKRSYEHDTGGVTTDEQNGLVYFYLSKTSKRKQRLCSG